MKNFFKWMASIFEDQPEQQLQQHFGLVSMGQGMERLQAMFLPLL